MSLTDLADLALSGSRELPSVPLSTNGLWTSRSPVLLPPSPIPDQPSIPIPDHTSLPLFPRHSFGFCASQSGDLYFYGGQTEGQADELYHYSIRENTVTPLQCWGQGPGARYDHSMALVGSVIAVHGGLNGNGRYADASLYLLNLVSREWSRVTTHGDAPGERQNHSMVAVGATVYIFGGTEPRRSWLSKFRKLNELWAFDFNTLRTQPTWKLISPLKEQPLPRHSCSLVPYQTQLILFGGKGDKGRLDDVWTFDMHSRRWNKLRCTGNVPSPRYGHAAAILDDVIYVTGGFNDVGSIHVFALKIPNRRWYELKNADTTLSQRDLHAATCIGTRIFILGGRFDDGLISEQDSVHILDAKHINNSDLHTPEQLRELEMKFQNILSQQQSESKAQEGMRKKNLDLEIRVKELAAGLLKEKGNREASIGEVLAENSKLEEKVKGLEYEVEDLKRSQILMSILESPSRMDSLAHLQGINAQIIVDFLAEVLERQSIDGSYTDRRRILHFLSKLVKSTHIFPKRTELSNVQCNLTDPVNDEGGYGFIYKGVFKEQAVCVKAVRVLESGTKATRVLRAQAGELVLLAHVSHPNVIPLYGAYLSDEVTPRICIVSPWMENGDLASYLTKHPDTPQIPLIYDVAVGLEFLHDMGIVHADLKARNVLVSRSQRAMLADFGVATILHTGVGTTTAHDFSGTIFWMAPELLTKEELTPPTQQSDMWGFACLCYEVLTGEIPFVRHYRPQQLIAAFIKGHITPLKPRRNGDPDIPDGGPLMFAEKCWNYDPSQRPTAAEAVRILAQLNSQDNRPSMDDELAMFETVKNSRVHVKVDYARVLSIIRSK